MNVKIISFPLIVFFILVISVSTFSQQVDLKVEFYDFIYAYSGDYVSIVGKLANTGVKNYKDITILVKLYDNNNQIISLEKIVVPYILAKENRYFKKMSPKNMGIEHSTIEITDFSVLTENVCNEKISVSKIKNYKYETKFREYLAVEGVLMNNSDNFLSNVRIDAIFLDEDGLIIDLNSNIISSLLPYKCSSFKISSPYVDKIHQWLFQITCFE